MLLLLLTSAWAADADLLMLGNSYTQFNDLQRLVEGVLLDTTPATEVRAARLTRGGLTLADHAAMASEPGEWAEALADDWDWVVLQDQSQVPGFPQTEPLWIASRDGAVVLDGLAAPAQTVFLLTWGRRDGDSSNPGLYPDFETMQDRLTEGYLAYAAACGEDGTPAFVAPAGWAFAEVREAVVAGGGDPGDPGSEFHRLYDGDGSHPSPEGSWLAALTVSRALTGRDLDAAVPPGGVDPELAELLRASATAAVRPFEELDYAWAFEWAEYGSASIAGDLTCPTVRITEGVLAEEPVSVGVGGCGRLWVDGGALLAGSLTVDEGELALLDGEVGVDDLEATSVRVEGGSLAVVRGAVDSLELGEGFLSVEESLEVRGSWSPGGALLLLDLGTFAGIDVRGTATLAGTLLVEELPANQPTGEVVLLRATVIDTTDLTADLPLGAGLDIVEDGVGGRELVLSWEGGPGEPDEPGCGCGQGVGGAWAAVLALVGLRRRRRESRAPLHNSV